MKPPKFSDKHRFTLPYVDAKATSEPGYLAARFKMIREQQEKDEAEKKEKVRRFK